MDARTALAAWSSSSRGAPQMAMMASPMNLSNVPPCARMMWLMALGAFLIDLAEEIAGDAMDMQGDKLLGSRSLALQFGRTAALRVSAGLFALVFILTPLPLILGWLGIQYLLAILVADTALVYFTVKLLRSKDSKEGVFAMRGIYLGFTAGMIVYILGQFLL